MSTLLQFCPKLGKQLVCNPDIEDDVMEHHKISLEAIHTFYTAPHNVHIYGNCSWIVTPFNTINNILAAGQIVKTTLEHIFHVCPDHGCVAPAILVMCLMWSSTMIESAAAFFEI